MKFHIFMTIFAAVCALTIAFEYSEGDYSDYEDSGEHDHHHGGKYPKHYDDYHGHYHQYHHYPHHGHKHGSWEHKDHPTHEIIKQEVKEVFKPEEHTIPTVTEALKPSQEEMVAATEVALAEEDNSGTVNVDFQPSEENKTSVNEESLASDENKNHASEEYQPHDEHKCCPCHGSESKVNPVVEPQPGPKYDLNEGPQLFAKFIKDYSKQYKDDADYRKHYDSFLTNLQEINRMNAERGSASFDINEFADLDDDEIATLIGSPTPRE